MGRMYQSQDVLKRHSALVRAAATFVLIGGLAVGIACSSQGSFSTTAQATTKTVPLTGWANSAVWHDGKAEVNTYQATRSIYGRQRNFELTAVVVKEEFLAGPYVKADWGSSGEKIPVLKLNVIQEVPTQNYPYRFMTSSFVRRDRPLELLKMTHNSSEWCGNTFKLYKGWSKEPQLEWHSYFQGEADGVQKFSDFQAGRDMLEEQLPVSLRALDFQQGLKFPVRILSRQLSSHQRSIRWREGMVEVVGQESVKSAGGQTYQTWHVKVDAGGDRLSFWFDTAKPHTLIKHEAPGGVRWLLKESKRWAYWQ